MKRLLPMLLLLGSCTGVPKAELPSMNVATVFRDCEEASMSAFPVQRVKTPRGQPTPTVQCKLTDIVRCDQQQVQTVVETDANEKNRKAYVMQCVRDRLE